MIFRFQCILEQSIPLMIVRYKSPIHRRFRWYVEKDVVESGRNQMMTLKVLQIVLVSSKWFSIDFITYIGKFLQTSLSCL